MVVRLTAGAPKRELVPLSRIGCKAENQGTKIDRDDRDVKASLFYCVRQAFRL